MPEIKMDKLQKKIIIVEDDRNINRLISYNLSKNGFASESAYDGLEAKNRLAHESFDIVILDIMLPGVDGYHICREIKENKSNFKTFIIMLTAKGESQDKLYGYLLGADYYMTKPFSVEKLMNVVEELSGVHDRQFIVKTNYQIGKSTQRKGVEVNNADNARDA